MRASATLTMITPIKSAMSPVRIAVASALCPALKADAVAGRAGRPSFVEPERRSRFSIDETRAHGSAMNEPQCTATGPLQNMVVRVVRMSRGDLFDL